MSNALLTLVVPSSNMRPDLVNVDTIPLLSSLEYHKNDQAILERIYRFEKRWGMSTAQCLDMRDKHWEEVEPNGES